jgi:hypothetical protein
MGARPRRAAVGSTPFKIEERAHLRLAQQLGALLPARPRGEPLPRHRRERGRRQRRALRLVARRALDPRRRQLGLRRRARGARRGALLDLLRRGGGRRGAAAAARRRRAREHGGVEPLARGVPPQQRLQRGAGLGRSRARRRALLGRLRALLALGTISAARRRGVGTLGEGGQIEIKVAPRAAVAEPAVAGRLDDCGQRLRRCAVSGQLQQQRVRGAGGRRQRLERRLPRAAACRGFWGGEGGPGGCWGGSGLGWAGAQEEGPSGGCALAWPWRWRPVQLRLLPTSWPQPTTPNQQPQTNPPAPPASIESAGSVFHPGSGACHRAPCARTDPQCSRDPASAAAAAAAPPPLAAASAGAPPPGGGARPSWASEARRSASTACVRSPAGTRVPASSRRSPGASRRVKSYCGGGGQGEGGGGGLGWVQMRQHALGARARNAPPAPRWGGAAGRGTDAALHPAAAPRWCGAAVPASRQPHRHVPAGAPTPAPTPAPNPPHLGRGEVAGPLVAQPRLQHQPRRGAQRGGRARVDGAAAPGRRRRQGRGARGGIGAALGGAGAARARRVPRVGGGGDEPARRGCTEHGDPPASVQRRRGGGAGVRGRAPRGRPEGGAAGPAASGEWRRRDSEAAGSAQRRCGGRGRESARCRSSVERAPGRVARREGAREKRATAPVGPGNARDRAAHLASRGGRERPTDRAGGRVWGVGAVQVAVERRADFRTWAPQRGRALESENDPEPDRRGRLWSLRRTQKLEERPNCLLRR